MTYRDLFNSAVAFLSESSTDGDVSDYEERAAYILASFSTLTASADARYRKAHGLEPAAVSPLAQIDLDSDFPLHAAFAPIGEFYLAANLCIDENEAMSDRFFDSYADALSSLLAGLPTARESTTDVYGLI